MDAQELARFSQAAYDPYNPDNQFDDWVIDRRLSDANKTVYSHVYGPEAVIAYRGTDWHNLSDVVADGFIAAGDTMLSGRFMRAENTAKRAALLYGKDNLTLTGHSLGGAEALFVSRRLGITASAFNPGAAFADIRQGLVDSFFSKFFRHSKTKASIYTTGRDPISIGSVFGPEKHFVKKPKSWNVHEIGNFL